MSLPGTRILPSPPLASSAVVQALHNVVTPHISDNLGRHIGARGLTRYNRSGKLVGTALTVKTRPGDNLYIYKALTLLQPGHVLVVDGQADTTNAMIGELIKLYALQRGCVGFVIDGAIRDVASFEDVPCYARDVVHCGPYKTGPGEINVPVSIGGMIIEPGDLIVGDEDGLVAFPQALADDVLRAAARHAEFEEAVKAEIATGNPSQSWIEAPLKKFGLLENAL
ncbi:RraA family protein [Pseudomonas sp. 21LCFQ010]|uniref:RraA family protein n=1 Tax=Pseudomonas sp. 21LCFQ010 TaxID=2957506 RepID=UPI00209702E9|nr:RraA family protein [Pseudomonas sp. 21LCFQ010]MCO8166062.1 RraA family protein [Pseudomonas sp. 21LCFQ010]